MTAFAYRNPRPSFFEVRRGFLLYHGKLHSIELMPSSLFKAIILERYPAFAQPDAFNHSSLDIVDRWHILMRYDFKLFKKGECC